MKKTKKIQNKIIECVPNFSEGKDRKKIEQIIEEIKNTKGARLLDVSSDESHNRTVVTFVGGPKAVKEAGFRAIAKASEVIDMSAHKGEHPRFGACDVCPFIPIQNVTMKECAILARDLGKMVGKKLRTPVFLYEEAAKNPERKNLAVVREGEYEGLEDKLKNPQWKPDFGRALFNKKSGAIAIGARMFLIAYNVNLKTSDKSIADNIARIIRESGWVVTLDSGKKVRIPGALKSVKAAGVFLGEEKVAQVSMNLTNYRIVPMHIAYEMIKKLSEFVGVKVLGSEIVGVVTKEAMLDTGRFYCSEEASEEKLIKSAIKNLGLDKIEKFVPEEKIIEYMI